MRSRRAALRRGRPCVICCRETMTFRAAAHLTKLIHSQLTSQPKTIPSCHRRSRHAEFQRLSGRHACPSKTSLFEVPCSLFPTIYVLVIARRTSRVCLKNTATALAGIIAGRGHSKQRDIHSIPSRAQARHLALPTRRPLCQLHHLGRHPQAVPRLNGGAGTS